MTPGAIEYYYFGSKNRPNIRPKTGTRSARFHLKRIYELPKLNRKLAWTILRNSIFHIPKSGPKIGSKSEWPKERPQNWPKERPNLLNCQPGLLKYDCHWASNTTLLAQNFWFQISSYFLIQLLSGGTETHFSYWQSKNQYSHVICLFYVKLHKNHFSLM